ncbi:hypothetical protein NTE_00954 [Candidatus Nitrososphaera evergladensis SR1]|uniref:Uncharacterized protein n=1 Tax=Candidatus Nitrososphaera evergladensis SR1 TaxID=1459636 RepID=A0A075MUP2_9ARCH|nr:hypothetical protein NTE_00954 [Candidatus Nitrososphaera evergladensis SR1]
MTLSDSDRGKLDKAIDTAVSLAPVYTELATSQIGKDTMKITNGRDFVLGCAFATVIRLLYFTGKSEDVFTSDHAVEMLAVMRRRFFAEIDILKVPKSNLS